MLAKLDQRTREARLIRETRAGLVQHVGGSPTVPQRMLIERACHLTLRIALMDQRLSETGLQTEHDTKVYLGWGNALSRLLRQIGMKSQAQQPPSLRDHLAHRQSAA
jgi:hypothetical protein